MASRIEYEFVKLEKQQDVPEILCEFAKEMKADLFVIGSRENNLIAR